MLWAGSLSLLPCHTGYGGGRASFSSVCVWTTLALAQEGCCACAQCVGAMLFLPGEMWWQWGQALGALCEQHDLTSSMLLLGTWLCHGDNRGHRALRGGDLEHLSCAAIRHKGTACSALGWVRNET